MSQDTLNTILLFLGALVVAVLFVLDRQGRRLSESIPPELMPLIMGLLALAETLAKSTETTADDDLVKQIKEALGQPVPTPTPIEQPTVEELVLDPEAQG